MGETKSEQTRGRLMDAMARGLREQGFAATGLRDVLERSGVPRGSLYHHFPGGKAELASATLTRSGRAIVGRLEALLKSTGDVVAGTRAFCDGYAAELEASEFRKGCPLATAALEAAPTIDEIHTTTRDAFGAIEALFTRALIADGLAPARAQDLASMVLAAVEGALLLAKAERSVRPLHRVRDALSAQLEGARVTARTGLTP